MAGVDGIALTAIQAIVSEGRFIEAGAVIRATDFARRRVFLAVGVHLYKLGAFQLHGIETSCWQYLSKGSIGKTG
jgi:hypothetical protein